MSEPAHDRPVGRGRLAHDPIGDAVGQALPVSAFQSHARFPRVGQEAAFDQDGLDTGPAQNKIQR